MRAAVAVCVNCANSSRESAAVQTCRALLAFLFH